MQNIVLEDNIDQLFVKERHGLKTHAILKEVRRNKVVLQCPEREDRFTISVSEFHKFFRKVVGRQPAA
jgi:hypothetical protein